VSVWLRVSEMCLIHACAKCRSGGLHRAQEHAVGAGQVPVRTQREQGRRSVDGGRADGRSGQAQPTAGGA